MTERGFLMPPLKTRKNMYFGEEWTRAMPLAEGQNISVSEYVRRAVLAAVEHDEDALRKLKRRMADARREERLLRATTSE